MEKQENDILSVIRKVERDCRRWYSGDEKQVALYVCYCLKLEIKWAVKRIERDLGGFKLSPKESNILKLNEEGKTYEDIGKLYGVTRERIRQIIEKANLKLRYSELCKDKNPESTAN